MVLRDWVIDICLMAKIVDIFCTSKKTWWTFYFANELIMKSKAMKGMDNFMTGI